MKVMVLGGDGFCGWPTALHLSQLGHEVAIIDNLSRRKIDIDLAVDSLTPITSINTRLQVWQTISGQLIQFFLLDVANDYHTFVDLLETFRPDAIVHFAEQRSAPYSMQSERTKRYTVNNNLTATHNVLCGIVESGLDIYLVHLGSIGVYGYHTAGIRIPEGYLSVNIQEDNRTITQKMLYPPHPDSIYHMTKAQDQVFFYYYNKNDNLRITDLHQGIVWGTQTQETKLDERLINRFDYDGIYGTVLNRFIIQATLKQPLTVYGTGGQTRAFIHIQDTVRCIELALNNPPKVDEPVQILNQITQTHTVKLLAEAIASMTGASINYLPNLRVEPQENEFIIANECLLSMGLNPITLEKGLIGEVQEIAQKYQHRCSSDKMEATAKWRKNSYTQTS